MQNGDLNIYVAKKEDCLLLEQINYHKPLTDGELKKIIGGTTHNRAWNIGHGAAPDVIDFVHGFKSGFRHR